MATELFRKRMISLYQEIRDPDMFLSGFFQTPAENIFDGEKVTVDVERSGEDVAIVIEQVGSGPRMNSADLFTNKEFTPPSYNEGMPFNVYDLLKREPGVNEYDATNVSWASAMVSRIAKGFRKLDGKVGRAIELQASQVLQTGILDLKDSAGNTLFTIDFKPKATHFPTAGTVWGQVGADPLSDLKSLANEIRKDSLRDSNRLIFGEEAMEEFLRDAQVRERLDNRRINVGMVEPESPGAGGVFHGTITIGQYRYEMWTYDGRYKDPQTGVSTAFVDSGKVIMLGRDVRLDKLFGGVPRSTPVDPRFADFLPDRIAIPQAIDFAPNIYATPNGKQTMIEVESRPLLVPTAIDGFGCLDTGL